ncbi:hypothetical protein BC835DRAFT_449739 [Cytidiella melzeri]|nr:hypothetical protein BC835DRAFT_449739 [Cytidiella melzeri]
MQTSLVLLTIIIISTFHTVTVSAVPYGYHYPSSSDTINNLKGRAIGGKAGDPRPSLLVSTTPSRLQFPKTLPPHPKVTAEIFHQVKKGEIGKGGTECPPKFMSSKSTTTRSCRPHTV